MIGPLVRTQRGRQIREPVGPKFEDGSLAFDVNFLRNTTEKTSGYDMQVSSLAEGRYSYNTDGYAFGENQPTLDSKGLLCAPYYENLIGYSGDITQTSEWVYNNNVNVTGTNVFTPTEYRSGVFQVVPTTVSEKYTFTFKAKLNNGGRGTDWTIRHINALESARTAIVLTDELTEYVVTITANSTAVQFGIEDEGSSNYAEVYVTDFQVTESDFKLPYIPTTNGIGVSAENNSDADQGYKFQITPDDVAGEYTGVTGAELNTLPVILDFYIARDSVSEGLSPTVGARTTDWIPVDPNTQYILESEGDRMRIQFKNGSGVITYSDQSAIAEASYPTNIYTDSDTVLMRIYFTISVETELSCKKVSRNMGMPDLLDVLEGKADGENANTANPYFTDWSGGAPVGYTVSNSDVNNYVEEHPEGMRIVSNNTSVLTIFNYADVQPETEYELSVAVSHYVSGEVRVKVRDTINGPDIFSAENIGSPGKKRFTTPAGCTRIQFYLYRDNVAPDGITDYVVNALLIKPVSPPVGTVEVEFTTMHPGESLAASGSLGLVTCRNASVSSCASLGRSSDGNDYRAILFDSTGSNAVLDEAWNVDETFIVRNCWGDHPTEGDAKKVSAITRKSTGETFIGAYNDFNGWVVGDYLTVGYGCRLPVYIKSIKFYKEAKWPS